MSISQNYVGIPVVIVSINALAFAWAYYSAIMVFSNPDTECFVATDHQIQVSGQDFSGATDVSFRFRLWFIANLIEAATWAIIYTWWASIMLHTHFCRDNVDKWAALPWYSMVFCMLPGLLVLAIQIVVVLVGYGIRESKTGKACSGDFYDG